MEVLRKFTLITILYEKGYIIKPQWVVLLSRENELTNAIAETSVLWQRKLIHC